MITDESIIAMIQGCPLLETINISAWNRARYHPEKFIATISVTNAALYAIAEYCHHLRSLSLSSKDPLAYDDDGLDAIKHGCRELMTLHMEYVAPGNDEDGSTDDNGYSDTDSNSDSD